MLFHARSFSEEKHGRCARKARAARCHWQAQSGAPGNAVQGPPSPASLERALEQRRQVHTRHHGGYLPSGLHRFLPTLLFDYVPQDQWRAFRYEQTMAAGKFESICNTLPKFYTRTGRPLVWIGECLEHTLANSISDLTKLRPIWFAMYLASGYGLALGLRCACGIMPLPLCFFAVPFRSRRLLHVLSRRRGLNGHKRFGIGVSVVLLARCTSTMAGFGRLARLGTRGQGWRRLHGLIDDLSWVTEPVTASSSCSMM